MSAAMGDSDCNQYQPMLAAYALGALESEERSRVDQHLATCANCRAEAASYAYVVDSLGVAAPLETPPPALRERVLAAAAGRAFPADVVPSVDSAKAAAAATSSTWRSNRLVVLLSAASILLLIGVAVLAVLLTRTVDERDDAIAAQEQFNSYFTADGKALAMTALEAANWGSWRGRGTLFMAPGEPTIVFMAGCPPSSSTRIYRVWVAVSGDRTGLGTIEVDDSGTGWMEVKTSEALTYYDQLGVTVVTDGDNPADMLVTDL